MNQPSQQIRIALPSKGRMEEETLDFLAAAGLHVSKTNPRQYSASIPALPGALVLFQRTADIPKSVAAGDMDLGVAGYDNVVEALNGDLNDVVIIHDALGYGECELVVAVPEEWHDVTDASLAEQRAPGARSAWRPSTSTRSSFFAARGIEQVRIVSAKARWNRARRRIC